MKIAMIGQKGIPASYGGIERHVEEISTRLVERGHEVTVFCRPHYTKLKGEYKGVRLVSIPSVQTKHFDTASHCALSAFQTLIEDYDIVHFHALGPSIFAGVPKIRRAKTVVTVHGLDWRRDKWGKVASWILRRCEYTSVRFPSRTIVVSKVLKDYFRSKYGRVVTYIPNGTNLPCLREPSKILEMGIRPHKYVLFVGRLVPEKGCHYLIEAFKKIDADLDLVIAGGTSFSGDYVDRLRAMGNEKARFLGYVYGDVLDELYSNTRLFVLPSDLEGLPIALLEAMSFGNCCLASDIPENLEVLAGCGVTFAHGDVGDLEEKMSSLLTDSDVCRAAGQRAREHVLETYNWDRVTHLTEVAYYSILSRSTSDAEDAGDGSTGVD